MPTCIYSAQNIGLQADIIDVEVDISKGLHSFSIVGLPDKSVEEAKDRIGAAIKNSDLDQAEKIAEAHLLEALQYRPRPIIE